MRKGMESIPIRRSPNALPRTGQAPLNASGSPSIISSDCVRTVNEVITGRTDDEGFSSHTAHELCPWFIAQILEPSDRKNLTREIVRTKLAEGVSHSQIVQYVTKMTEMSRSWGYREINRQIQQKSQ